MDEYIDRLLESEGREFLDKLCRDLVRRGYGGNVPKHRLDFKCEHGVIFDNVMQISIAVDGEKILTKHVSDPGDFQFVVRVLMGILTAEGWIFEKQNVGQGKTHYSYVKEIDDWRMCQGIIDIKKWYDANR